MSVDHRLDTATRHADVIREAARVLSSAIYEARRDGYRASVALRNAVEVGDLEFVGTRDPALVVEATVAFDVGRRVAL